GLGGGVAAPLGIQGAGSLTASAARGVRAAAQPFTTTGRESIAGTILRNQADDAGRAINNLDASTEIVPGSIPTTGAASRDAGLLALEKGIRSRNPSPFATRLSEQNAARQAALDRIAGTPKDIADDIAARDAITTPLREDALRSAAPVDLRNVDRMISRILAGEAGERQAVQTTLNSVRRRLYEDYPEDQMIRDARSVVDSAIGRRMSGKDFNSLKQARTALNSAVRG